MTLAPFSPKQYEFLSSCTATWNLAHGAVRTGKTMVTLYGFMHAVDTCPGSVFWIIGYSAGSAYRNVVKLLFENDLFSAFAPFLTWHKIENVLTYKDKVIQVCGAENTAAVGRIQGQTVDLIYCDEMTLYPESVTYMIDTRLSNDHSRGFGAMNPANPNHIIKQWIDKGQAGNKNYYSQHYTLEDNPYVDDDYKNRIRDSLSGIFYKRNYLGLWVLAEGAIFDFFDKRLHVVNKPPRAAEYWIAGIDYGTRNSFACILIGVSTGKYEQGDKKLWVEKEYVWDSSKKHKQKTNSEYADDVQAFLDPYGVKAIYIDPSALSFKTELRRRSMHTVDATNDVLDGIAYLSDEIKMGRLFICEDCKSLITEIEGYVWDHNSARNGVDEPVKQNDHSIDATRYAIFSHKVSSFNERAHYQNQEQELRQKYHPGGYGYRSFN